MSSEAQTVLHTWCRPTEWNAPTIVGGAGARLQTADGRSILDMSSLSECTNLGHQHPRVVAAIRAQAQRAVLRHQRVGCRTTRAAGRDAAGEVGLRRWPRVLHPRGHRRQRARREVRPPGERQTPRLDHHARSLLSRLQLRGHGVLRGLTHRGSRSIRRCIACCTCPRRTPTVARFVQRTSEACGIAAADCVSRRRSMRAAPQQIAAVLMEPNAGTNGIVAPDSFWPALRARHPRARRVPDRRRSHERLRPLRRVVRLAALRRGRPPRSDDARQRPHRRARCRSARCVRVSPGARAFSRPRC